MRHCREQRVPRHLDHHRRVGQVQRDLCRHARRRRVLLAPQILTRRDWITYQSATLLKSRMIKQNASDNNKTMNVDGSNDNLRKKKHNDIVTMTSRRQFTVNMLLRRRLLREFVDEPAYLQI